MRSGAKGALLALLALGASFCLGANAAAALEPGTPIPVAPGVPDQGRAWELVTPPDPNSATLYNVRALSPDANHLSYMTIGPLPGAPAGAPYPTATLATRTPTGWANQPVVAPNPLLGGPGYLFDSIAPGPLSLSPELESSVWTSYLPLKPGQSENEGAFFRRSPDGNYTLLAEAGRSALFLGASKDLQRVFFSSEQHLLAADGTRSEGRSIYEIDDQTLRLVDVDEEGALLSQCGSSVLMNEGGVAVNGAISADGQRVFLSSRPGCGGPARVYLRQAGAETTEISASQCDLPDCGPAADVSFLAATPSGSDAFLLTEARLTDQDTNTFSDLYRYDVPSGELTLISSPPGGAGLALADPTLSVSDDGSRVYFKATVQAGPDAGAEHLYLADGEGLHVVGPGESSLSGISADGRYALLLTPRALVPGDSDGRADVYRYEASNGAVIPISVAGPAGGNGPFEVIQAPEYVAQSAPSQPYRVMSEDGSRIFFSTQERLVSQDRDQALDVYEWANGTLGLISSGANNRPDIYLGSTPDGRSVLFRTSATLLPADRDGGDMDFYVARIGGGFPEAAAPKGCEVQGCRLAPPARGGRASPTSAKASKDGIAVRRPGLAERRRFVASGQIALLAEVPRPGKLSAVARAEIGQHAQTVASTDVVVSRAGPVRLRMGLSQEARERLKAGEDLRVRLTLGLSHLAPKRRLGFELEGER